MRRVRPGRVAGEGGAAALETVLVLPVVALLLVALLGSLGLIGAQLSVTQAARAAARAVALSGQASSAHTTVARAVPDALVRVDVRGRVARVEVVRRATLLGVAQELRATAVAPLEPAAP